ncbi:MAG: ribose-5-phosphate isomerase RpiA [Archaeoglobi archaeon]|nr:ribose-5-phosphate isomerase RpiA [Candidatus Mnemosynella bozhongmuii]
MNLKRNAALSALKLVEDGMVLGLGTGSTAEEFLLALSERIRSEELEIIGIPTSFRTKRRAIELGIPLSTLDEHPEPDLAVDGADEVTESLHAIKGGGGAHTMEKIVAYSSKKFLIIVDESKLSGKLSRAVPLEIIPSATPLVERELSVLGARLILREGTGKYGPVISENGNLIADAVFREINNPEKLERELNAIPGVVENGIFSRCDEIHCSTRDGIRILKKS